MIGSSSRWPAPPWRATCRCSASAAASRSSTSPAAGRSTSISPTPTLHLHTPGRFGDHDVRLEPGSLAARTVGAERATVRSHHHQGVGRLGEGLVASGWAEPGGMIEAIEMSG